MSDNASRFQPLKNHFGNRVITDTHRLPDYSHDASEIRIQPAAVFFAESEADVVEAVSICRENNLSIVFRGAGTGYTGGAVPVPGALILSLEQLDKLELDPAGKIAYCGPGVITLDLMNTARAVGLFYPPDPASCDESSLGGNVAENAGGLHCKKYGVTKDYVIGLRAVTIEGEVLCTGVYSEGDLFDLTGILLGSEGLLAAVTEIAVRLIDLPRSGPTILAAFDRPENAAQAVSDITCSGVIPSVMEYMDGDAAACSNRYEKTLEIEQAAAILLIETSGETSEKQADQIYDICRKHHASLLKREANPENAERLWKLRRNLSKAVKASAEEKISEDICVPPSRLPELVSFVAELNAEYSFRVNSYGHAGDGNLHVNFLVERPDEVDIGLVEAGVRRLFARTLELDGTLTGEHGIGLTKKEYLHLEFDPATLAHMKKIKTVFDADNLLNPGKMFT